MENICSFVSIVGGQCGHDRRDRNRTTGCIPLLSCERDINGHKAMFLFHDIDNEIVTLFGKTGLNKNSVVMHFECVDNAF